MSKNMTNMTFGVENLELKFDPTSKNLAAQRKFFQFLNIEMSKNMTYMTFWVEFLNIKMFKNMTYMTF